MSTPMSAKDNKKPHPDLFNPAMPLPARLAVEPEFQRCRHVQQIVDVVAGQTGKTPFADLILAAFLRLQAIAPQTLDAERLAWSLVDLREKGV